jgi:DNA-binding NtrC family response regulator
VSVTGTTPLLLDRPALPAKLRLTARFAGKTLASLVFSRGTITVGSAPENDLVIPHHTVSRRHLEVSTETQALYVRDLESRNGTRLAGSKIGEAFIAIGHALMLGLVELRIDDADEAEASRFGSLEGVSAAMRAAIEDLRRVASTDATVLLEAETGSGKDVAARAIHQGSPRMKGPFETLDCGSLPADLAAAELFGHVKGAFTSAERARSGAFERASGGSLFLDEIGELPLELQPLLLRVLESREVRRVGDGNTVRVDVRVIAATNRNLEAEVAAGRFRADLMHRLAVVRVRLPPLRERLEDLPVLVRSILDELGPRAQGFVISNEVLRRLAANPWPGNVRELRNFIERALALGSVGLPEGDADEGNEAGTLDYKQAREEALASFERDYLVHLLRRFDGNVSKAAREASLDRAYLHRLIKKHGLETGR